MTAVLESHHGDDVVAIEARDISLSTWIGLEKTEGCSKNFRDSVSAPHYILHASALQSRHLDRFFFPSPGLPLILT